MSNSDDCLENVTQVVQKFQQGQQFFEAGRYREAIQSLSQACALVDSKSKLEGEISLWLVTAYDASGKQEEALCLCRQLIRSPYIDIRRQSKRLLTILEAPKLSIHDDWVTKIPPLESVNEPGRIQGATRQPSRPRPSPSKLKIEEKEVDLSQVTIADRGLTVGAVIFVMIISAGLIWIAY